MFRLLRLSALTALIFVFASHARPANVLGNEPGTRDGLLLLEGAALKSAAKGEGIVFSETRGIELAPGATTGYVDIPNLKPSFAYTEIIPSWNGRADGQSGFRVLMQASGRGWQSPIIEAGTWGAIAPQQVGVLKFPGGTWHIDYGVFDNPADQVSLRVELLRQAPDGPSPAVNLIALSYTGRGGARSISASARSLPQLQRDEALPIPFHSQVVPRKEWIGRLCSPASVSSVSEFLGAKATTQQMAEALYDPANDLFGVWNRSIMGPAQLGVRGYITRFRNWNDVRAAMAQGQAVCASIRFALGEVSGAPVMYKKRGTEGHLVVIVGFTKDGKVITHDSSSKDNGVSCTWPADEFAKAWFDKGGVAYVFSRSGSRTTTRAPIAGNPPSTSRRR